VFTWLTHDNINTAIAVVALGLSLFLFWVEKRRKVKVSAWLEESPGPGFYRVWVRATNTRPKPVTVEQLVIRLRPRNGPQKGQPREECYPGELLTESATVQDYFIVSEGDEVESAFVRDSLGKRWNASRRAIRRLRKSD
jgi:hypothetical protein